ncbi:hypothetical protein B0H19DRAFT_1067826 [Mycena capillaripes]|nr:hypothetical protein B0H19DRAFT_1067826 [Mycena capillaripes]
MPQLRPGIIPEIPTIHLQNNLTGERAALRQLYRERGTTVAVVDSDSDVEVVLTQTKGKKCAIKEEDDSDIAPARQHPRLSIHTHLDEDDVIIIDTTFSTPASSPAPAPWPAGMYVVDMVEGFKNMASGKLKGLNQEQRFGGIFQQDYHPSTYDSKARKFKSESATSSQLEMGRKAGRTTDGLWTVWRKRIDSSE